MIFNISSADTLRQGFDWLECVKAFSPIIGALVAGFFVWLTVRASIRNTENNARYQYATKALDLRLKQISEFYGPLRLQVEQSKILYNKMLWLLRRHNKQNPTSAINLDGFRLLDHIHTILNKQEYEDIRPIARSILKLGESISEIIAKNSGLVEGGITTTLIEYRAHLQMLKAAARQPPPSNTSEGWQEFGYYPRILNREIIEGYKEVLRHFEVFQEAGDDIVWRILGRMPESKRRSFRELLDNLNYYEKNVESYAARFDGFDLSELRNKFTESALVNLAKRTDIYGPKAPRLLEVGCGTGRDAAAFIESGFIVNAFDISPSMVRLSNRKIRNLRDNSECGIAYRARESNSEERTFDEILYRNEFDAIWASASLLHVPKKELPSIIYQIMRAAKPFGVVFMSFKYGKGESEFDSRHYSYFKTTEIIDIVEKTPNSSILDCWISNKTGNRISQWRQQLASVGIHLGQSKDFWVNVIIEKKLN